MEARWPLEQMTQAVPVARNRVNLAGQVGHVFVLYVRKAADE